jgi:Zn-dependent membrane protease YugP
MPIYFGYDSGIFLVILAAILGFVAQNAVQNTYRKFSRQASHAGITAAQAAQIVLQSQGVYDVSIGRVRGTLTDHYDPRSKTLRLSEGVYDSTSIAALGIAAHEAGHAIQHDRSYAPLMLRNSIVPAVNFGSRASMPLLLIGLFLNSYLLALLGVALYGLAVAFQLITLPVELDASRRAMRALSANGLLTQEEEPKARKVLSAAASTYLASAFAAVAQLLRLLTIVSRDRRRD